MQQNKDQFGVYRVGDLKFYSKVEAIEMHTRTGIHPHWDFNETVFSAYDWTQEPQESLSELYRRRAQQLRDQYDYLVLWYSSGADSNNVLQSFLDNGIRLDEVASFVNYEGTHDRDDYYLNGEVYNIAAETVEHYQETWPDLKYRMVDMCQSMIDFFNNPQNMFDWRYSMNAIFNPNSTVRSTLFRSVDDWKNLIDSGKKVAFIWGIDKPRLDLVDNKYCFKFIDIVDLAASPRWQMESRPGEYIEFFYWTPDLPEIAIKQGHVVKNYLRSATPDSQWMLPSASGLGHIEKDGRRAWISTLGVNSLVYPNYRFDPLNEFKPPAAFYSPRDTWFFNLPETDNAYYVWNTALTALWKEIPDYWKNDPTDSKKAFKNCVSKPYFLE